MTLFRLAAVCCVAATVSACAIPELIAHGIKEYDRAQRQGQPSDSTPAPQPVAEPAVVRSDVPPPAVQTNAPVPAPHNAVTVEPLPPR